MVTVHYDKTTDSYRFVFYLAHSVPLLAKCLQVSPTDCQGLLSCSTFPPGCVQVVLSATVKSSFFQTVENVGCGSGAYAYITDMGSNAVIVYSMKDDDAWRVQNHYFHFDPHAGVYSVGGIDFYWSDGVSSATLSKPKPDG